MNFNLTRTHGNYTRRILRTIMKTFIFLFCTVAFSFGSDKGFSQNADIYINADKIISVEEIFHLIKTQAHYQFVYDVNMVSTAPSISVKKGIIKAGKLLEKGLTPVNCTFEFTQNTIIVKKKRANKTLQEEFPISGRVVDKNGEPIPGVSVYISDRDVGDSSKNFIVRGTDTDFEGNFKLKATLNHYLIVGSLGYKIKSIQITSKQEYYEIVMEEEINVLDDIVVVGYGRAVKKDYTGSIGSVKSEEVKQVKSQTIDQALVGQLSGVFVNANGGAPGSGASVNIRGLSQLRGDNQPLYVIDGVPINVNPNFEGTGLGVLGVRSNPLLAINPNDVERIDVLKDASGAAIYGSRAANGVIIVTTKKGRRNQDPKLSLSVSSTFQNYANDLDFLNAEQYRAFASEQAQITLNNFTGPPNFLPIYLPTEYAIVNEPDTYFGTANTNWQDEISNKNALWNQYNISYSGGTSNTNYLVSGTVSDQEGVLIGNKFNRYTFSGSVDTNISDKFKIGTSVSYNHSVNKTSGVTGLGRANFRPDLPVFNEDGTYTSFQQQLGYGPNGTATVFNPVRGLGSVRNNTTSQNFLGNIYGEYEIIEGLKLKTQFAATTVNDNTENFQPSYSTGLVYTNFYGGFPAESLLTNQTNTGYNTSFENTLSYTKKINEAHKIDAVVGVSWYKNKLELNEQVFAGFPDDNVLTNSGNATNVRSYRSDALQSGLNSVFGRINYSYKDKYLATITARRDGSTKFGPNNRYGFFPSAALAWNIHNEDFLKDNSIINQLKLRTSFGRVGSDNVPDFTYLPLYTSLDNNDSYYNGSNGIVVNGVINRDIRWEETDQLDVALEFGLFNGRLNGEVNYFDKQTSGIILLVPAASQLGETVFDANVADVSNKGIEITIGGDVIRNENFRWNSSFNISFIKNKVENLSGGATGAYGSTTGIVEGEPIGVNYVYDVVGIAQTQQEVDDLNAGAPDFSYDPNLRQPGDYIFRDVNGDGEITRDDRVVKGDINPDFFGGWNNTLSYKNFDFSFNFQFVEGVDRNWERVNGLGGAREGYNLNYTTLVNDTWTPNNTDARYARFGSSTYFSENSRSIFDASYIRLRSASVRYNFPTEWFKDTGVSNASLQLSGNNLFTITDYPGIDPESVGPARGGSTVQFANDDDGYAYPQTRTFTIGLNVSF